MHLLSSPWGNLLGVLGILVEVLHGTVKNNYLATYIATLITQIQVHI